MARYLCASGAGQDLRRALFAYNHADWYVAEVVQLAERYDGIGAAGGGLVSGSANRPPINQYDRRNYRSDQSWLTWRNVDCSARGAGLAAGRIWPADRQPLRRDRFDWTEHGHLDQASDCSVHVDRRSRMHSLPEAFARVRQVGNHSTLTVAKPRRVLSGWHFTFTGSAISTPPLWRMSAGASLFATTRGTWPSCGSTLARGSCVGQSTLSWLAKDIIRAPNQRRRQLSNTLAERQTTVEALLQIAAVGQEEAIRRVTDCACSTSQPVAHGHPDVRASEV